MKEYTNERIRRKVALLSKYHHFNTETKVFDITLSYDSPDEVLETNFSNPEYPFFKNEVLNKVEELVDRVPMEYKSNLIFEFNSIGDYSLEGIEEAFNDAMELDNYSVEKIKIKQLLTAVVLFLIGLTILFTKATLSKNSWFLDSSSNAPAILDEVFDISAWVFVWEAVTIFFLSREYKDQASIFLKKRINKIIFRSKKDNFELEEEYEEIVDKWVYDPKTTRIGRYLLLIFSAGFFAIFVTGTIDFILFLFSLSEFIDMIKPMAKENDVLVIVMTLFIIVQVVLIILASISALTGLRFFFKPTKVNRVGLLVMSIIDLLSGVGGIVLLVILGFGSFSSSLAFLAVTSLGFALGYILLCIGNKVQNRNSLKEGNNEK